MIKTQKPRKKKKLVIRMILFILLLLLLAVGLHQCGYVRYPWDSQTMIIGKIKQGKLPGTDDELQAELQRQADESKVTVQLNSQPVFEDGKSEGSLYIGNPETNKYEMHIEIRLKETDELLYESGAIPPGYYIDYDKLQIALEKGTHSGKATVTYYEGDQLKSKTQFTIDIIVQN